MREEVGCKDAPYLKSLIERIISEAVFCFWRKIKDKITLMTSSSSSSFARGQYLARALGKQFHRFSKLGSQNRILFRRSCKNKKSKDELCHGRAEGVRESVG